MTEFLLNSCKLRLPRPSDAESIARYANDEAIARNLRDQFPSPYTLADANVFIQRASTQEDSSLFVIVVNEEAVGTIGTKRGTDVERRTGELGYWIGRPFWGRGLATEAIPPVVEQGFRELRFARIEAYVFDYNPASARVLEKTGFVREAVLRRSAYKGERVIDRWLYVRFPEPDDTPS